MLEGIEVVQGKKSQETSDTYGWVADDNLFLFLSQYVECYDTALSKGRKFCKFLVIWKIGHSMLYLEWQLK